MHTLARTISDILDCSDSLLFTLASKKIGSPAFTLVKLVTKVNRSFPGDYTLENIGKYFGQDTVTIKGQHGFIRVTLD